jgi:sRNA-binding carbon storage regulator CsrA
MASGSVGFGVAAPHSLKIIRRTAVQSLPIQDGHAAASAMSRDTLRVSQRTY